ncbi:glycosyltransferase family 2 protein [Bradyrhizobium sp. HKCCYLS3077]|uniref:glycosyltransferase family 2 protein n=1 Tax=unclassified Bradyrhizobium TaxID=2631580 RepID=UPI003EBBBF40
MSPARKTVSVVVPTNNRPALLREALASIRAVEQDDIFFEILVGDNGTSPETREIAEAFGAKYLHTSVNGSAAARNIALKAATSEYVAFLDDDDLWTSNHIRRHLQLLASMPELGMVVGQIINTDPQRQPIYGPWPPHVPEGGALVKLMLSGYFPQIGATVVKTSVREAIGLFDERLIGGQDWDWQLRIARRFGVGFVPEPCVLFRQRPTGHYDELQTKRVAFARRIFFRHAVPEWRLWSSPIDFARSYFETMQHFFYYFVETALFRARNGERAAALKAIWRAFAIFPTRATRSLLSDSPLRDAIAIVFRGNGPDKPLTRRSK